MKANILLVDDDSAFRHVLGGELQRLGYSTAAAGTGEEAVRRVAECEPDIVLLDLHMPKADGFEVLKALRDDESMRRLPVLALLGAAWAVWPRP